MNTFIILFTHELRRLFRDPRLLLATVAVAALAATGTWLRAADYSTLSHEYRAEMSKNEAEILHTGELNRLYDMTPPQVPPEPMAVFHEGIPLVARNVGTTEASVHEAAFNANPLSQMFPSLDLTTVVIWVIGLVTLLMAAVALSGERESGTFELLVTAGASSCHLVLAKWLAITVCSGAILACCMTTAWLAAVLSGLSFDHARISEFLLSSFASLLYLGSLAGLGVALSSKACSRARVMMSCAGLWMLISTILPSAVAHLLGEATRIPGFAQKRQQIEHILTNEREQHLNGQIATVYHDDNAQLERYLKPAGYNAAKFRALPDQQIDQVAGHLSAEDAGFRSLWDQEQSRVLDVIQSVWTDYQGRADSMEEQLRAQTARQTRFVLAATAFLPAVAYKETVSRLLGMSYLDLAHAERSQKDYKIRTVDYIFTKARMIGGRDPFNAHVSLDDRPRFLFQQRGAARRLLDASPFLLVLLAWTAGLLLFAVKATSR
ncbi:MAG: ABC transporter permease [Acidobacteriia bacterium]|nr:ABC transporter permease [Terriglobia bacterium]